MLTEWIEPRVHNGESTLDTHPNGVRADKEEIRMNSFLLSRMDYFRRFPRGQVLPSSLYVLKQQSVQSVPLIQPVARAVLHLARAYTENPQLLKW